MAETPTTSTGFPRQTKERQTTSMPESEDAVRNLKASESVEVAFSAAGFPSAPHDLAALVSSHVKSATRGIPLNQIAHTGRHVKAGAILPHRSG